ncbi:MAG: PilT/PilU family type 4a pilus ATPase [Planctomycetales bacterium]|nr:PilT/PilU family type 4a pilus ATPase [bacterium]UNM09191.1 MAG: PilT/PilU family type 4a pilus ATPase [Planctomycetales bacterium]
MHIDELLRIVIKKGASDLHLGAGRPPFLRLDGDLMPADWDILDEEEMERFAKQLLTPKREYRLEEENEIDFAYVYKGDDGLQGRFRVNLYRQKGSVAAALRLVNDVVPSFEELNLPLILEELSLERRGIIILTGTTGSGKSTTLASMIDYVNNRRPVHILTIEDPIEYVLTDKEAIINQRELGVDTNSFMDAIRGAMREDPDIILIGEMRDRETVNATFQAALTGHLVLSTLHTLNVTQTISRVIDFYPETMQKQARLMLSETIKSIISMRLLPMVGGGRIPAMEIMKVTGRIKEFIEDEEKTELIKLAMEEGEDEGMITFDRYLLKMYHLGQITYETALAAASSPHDFKLLEQQNTDFSDKVLNRVEQFTGTRGDGTPAGGI